jgi:hypothetical protein
VEQTERIPQTQRGYQSSAFIYRDAASSEAEKSKGRSDKSRSWLRGSKKAERLKKTEQSQPSTSGGMEMQDVAPALPPVEEQPGNARDAYVSYYDSEDGGQYRGGPYMGANGYDSGDASDIDSYRLNTHMQNMAERWNESGSQGGEMALAGLYRKIEESKGRYEWNPATQEEAKREGKRLAEYEIACRKKFTAEDNARAAAQKKAHDGKTQKRVERESQTNRFGRKKEGRR